MRLAGWAVITFAFLLAAGLGSGPAAAQPLDGLQLIKVEGGFLDPAGRPVGEYDYLEPGHKYRLLPGSRIELSTLDGQRTFKAEGPGILSFEATGPLTLNGRPLAAAAAESALQSVTATGLGGGNLGAIRMRGPGGVQVEARTAGGGTKLVPLYSGYHALVLGCGDYKQGWPKLPNPVKDAREVAAVLESQGWEVDLFEDPDGEKLERALTDLITGPGREPDKAILIWFSGHGHTLKEADGTKLGYIVPVDAPHPSKDEAGFMRKAMDMRRMETVAKRIRSKHVLMVFDSCFSGAIFSMVRAIPSAYIEEKVDKPVRQFITAGDEQEAVPDRSVFKTCFVQAVTEGYADLNRDGYVTGEELGAYLQEQVVNYSQKAQHPQYGKINNPRLDKGDFVFASLAPRTGQVLVSSNVDGADFELAGQRLQTDARQPVTVDKIPPGRHAVLARKTGHQDWRGEVEVKPGETASLSILMQPLGPAAGRVRVTSNVSGASFNLAGRWHQTSGETALTIDQVPPGEHIVVASKPGYQEWRGVVAVKSDEAAGLTIMMQPLGPASGRVLVTSNLDGASFNLAGQWHQTSGETALTIDQVPPGEHVVVASKPGHEEWRGVVKVESGQTARLAIIMQPRKPAGGRVMVSSNVDGAAFELAGKEYLTQAGQALVISDVPPAEYKVTVRKKGFQDWRGSVKVKPEVTAALTIVLEPARPPEGQVKVTSNVDGAELELAGQRHQTKAKGELTIDRVPPGRHAVLARKDGHQDWRGEVEVKPGAAASLKIDMQPLAPPTGRVRVTSNVDGAEFELAGTRFSTKARKAIVIGEVPAAEHEVIARKEGYQDWRGSVAVKPGAAARLSIEMKPVEPAAGSVRVSSNVDGVEFELAGRSYSTGAKRRVVVSDLAPAEYEVIARKEGYQDWRGSVVVKTKAPAGLSIEMKPLEPASGRIKVVSKVEGVEFELAGQRHRTGSAGDLILDKVPAGRHEVKARKEGYEDWQGQVSVAAGRTALVQVELKKKKAPAGQVVVTSNVDGVEISLAGQSAKLRAGDEFRFTDVPAGEHEVRASRDGYQDWSQKVTVQEDRAARISIEMKPEKETVARPEPKRPSIRGADGR